MAYSADSFVADEVPTTAKWNKLWSNDASFNDGTGIGKVLTPALHLLYGLVRSRKGGSASSWATSGTTDYDVSASNVFMQVGALSISANPTIVTFPTAFTQTPWVIGVPASASSYNTFAVQTAGASTTQAAFRIVDDGGVARTGETVNWLAIGV